LGSLGKNRHGSGCILEQREAEREGQRSAELDVFEVFVVESAIDDGEGGSERSAGDAAN